ncbi:hypothetical protein HanIR_Chr17g0852601 [Helianthus annuus]|nr:hypothetical protein HanIR_Chr17g0852601 [Helianthus annuus]
MVAGRCCALVDGGSSDSSAYMWYAMLRQTTIIPLGFMGFNFNGGLHPRPGYFTLDHWKVKWWLWWRG